MTFKELGVKEPILKTLENFGYTEPTDIQRLAIPHILLKKDLLGCAQTGTGKTAAFALPIIQNLVSKGYKNKNTTVLVLSPTRELAIQIKENFQVYSKGLNLRTSVIVGGVAQSRQVNDLRGGVDIIVATPGRLLDLVNQLIIDLRSIEVLVLDEADTMLDMGFVKDINRIVEKIPNDRQTLLFSATMPSAINKLAETYLKDHITVKVTPESTTVEKINQTLYHIDKHNKPKLLTDILKREETKSTLVFTRTKHGANNLSKTLLNNGIKSEVIHGNKSQSARVKALNNFKSGESNVMIATDIAARGIDINELSHVINYEMPNIPETYVHRIGRTGRAGMEGIAISFADIDELDYIKDIQNTIKQNIDLVTDHEYPMENFVKSEKKQNNGRRNNNKRSNNSNKKNSNSFGNNKKNSNSFSSNKSNNNNNFSKKNSNFSKSKSFNKRKNS